MEAENSVIQMILIFGCPLFRSPLYSKLVRFEIVNYLSLLINDTTYYFQDELRRDLFNALAKKNVPKAE